MQSPRTEAVRPSPTVRSTPRPSQSAGEDRVATPRQPIAPATPSAQPVKPTLPDRAAPTRPTRPSKIVTVSPRGTPTIKPSTPTSEPPTSTPPSVGPDRTPRGDGVQPDRQPAVRPTRPSTPATNTPTPDRGGGASGGITPPPKVPTPSAGPRTVNITPDRVVRTTPIKPRVDSPEPSTGGNGGGRGNTTTPVRPRLDGPARGLATPSGSNPIGPSARDDGPGIRTAGIKSGGRVREWTTRFSDIDNAEPDHGPHITNNYYTYNSYINNYSGSGWCGPSGWDHCWDPCDRWRRPSWCWPRRHWWDCGPGWSFSFSWSSGSFWSYGSSWSYGSTFWVGYGYDDCWRPWRSRLVYTTPYCPTVVTYAAPVVIVNPAPSFGWTTLVDDVCEPATIVRYTPSPRVIEVDVPRFEPTTYSSDELAGLMSWDDTPATIIGQLQFASYDQRPELASRYLGRVPAGGWDAGFEAEKIVDGRRELWFRGLELNARGDRPLIVVRPQGEPRRLYAGQRVRVTGRLAELVVDDPFERAGRLVLEDGSIKD